MQEAARVLGKGLVKEPLAAGPIIEPFDTAVAIGEIAGSELSELAGIGLTALFLRPGSSDGISGSA